MFCVSVGDLVGSQDTKIEQVPILRKKERKYNGMFEFKKGDENIIIRHLLCGKLYLYWIEFRKVFFFYSYN